MKLSEIRPSIRWGLGASALLSLLALWMPRDASRGVIEAHLPSGGAPLVALDPSTARRPDAPASAALRLPAELPLMALEPAVGDPFVGLVPPPPKPAPVQAAAPEPVVPQVPPLSYRFLGRFVSPTGEPMVYLSRQGDGKEVAVTVGSTLDEGFVVEAVRPEAVVLVYPPAGTRLNIAIPSAESQAQR